MPTFKRQDQEQLEKAQDLLDSGAPADHMGFVKSLFFGRLHMDELMPYPKQDPDEAQRTHALLEKVDAFLKEKVDADRIDREEAIPPEVIAGLGQLGVMGMTVPKQYGGGGFSHTAYCRVLERIGAHCASTAVMVGAHQSIGLKALVLMGNEEQKSRWLPILARGEKLAAFCLSEPQVGSDAANVQTTARLSDDGTHYLLNGDKRYATNAAIAGLMTVMAKTPVEIKGKMKDKVTAFIVTPDMPGFEVISPNRSKHGVRGSWQGTLKFTNMRVPKENILGELGKGLKVALSVLDYGRCTLSAGCVGGAKRALQMAIDHATTRRQFDRTIGSFGLIKQKIARMAEWCYAMDAMTYLAAGLVDRHHGDIMLETAIAKLFCSEGLWQIADDLMQIWAGEGYMREHGVERMLRDARINRIVEGTTEVMTAFVALVGMKGVGETLEGILRLTKHPVHNFGRLASFARQEFSDLVIGPHCDDLHPQLQDEGKTLSELTRRLARDVIRALRIHREGILDQQLVQERLAWAAIEIYAMAAVLSKLSAMMEKHDRTGNGDAKWQQNLLIGKSFCHHAADRISRRLDDLWHNRDDEIVAVADSVMGMSAAS
jgi:alkylation response protein AidB-like acyl-CoA dehydrogenase